MITSMQVHRLIVWRSNRAEANGGMLIGGGYIRIAAPAVSLSK